MNNLKDSFDLAVNSYVNELIQNRAVEGIVLTGSAGRDDYDELSDIDNVVIVNKLFSNESIFDIKEGKFLRGNFLFDTRIVTSKSFAGPWSDDMFFAYLKSAKIVADQHKTIKKTIDIKTEDWLKISNHKLFLSLVNLSVIFEFDDNWKNLKTTTHYQKYLERKDFISANRLLNIAFENVIDIIYFMNQSPIPDSKNKLKLLKNLTLLPNSCEVILSDSMIVPALTSRTLQMRYSYLSKLVTEIIQILNLHIDIPEDLYGYYLKNRS
ncbi:MAG: nucleotidyltransferase domain-containing protein [Bdellovibrionales bacterium]|nr:nucleotidyltransferase domain-containing protein [Bdellovibrionales bacterium]